MRRVLLAALLVLTLPASSSAQGGGPARVLNGDSIADQLTRRFPDALRRHGVTGTATIDVLVGADGKPDSLRISASTGLQALDRIATSLAHGLRMDAAGAGMWVPVPFGFNPRSPIAPRPAPLELANREALLAAVRAHYPEPLLTNRIAAAVPLSLLVDWQGGVTRVEVLERTCLDQAADAAERLAATARFEPSADLRARRIYMTVSFDPDSATILVLGDSAARQVAVQGIGRSVQMRRPELQNLRQVQRALVQHYPRALRDRGIGGTTLLWFFVDESGRVTKQAIRETSGNCELDLAALKIGTVMRFAPARRDGSPTEVWVEIPIQFNAR